jgi:hypothetical protein
MVSRPGRPCAPTIRGEPVTRYLKDKQFTGFSGVSVQLDPVAGRSRRASIASAQWGRIGAGISGRLDRIPIWRRPRIATVPPVRDRLRSSTIFVSMDLEYDPKREAVAAMKLAAEANGAERQRWITAALAWSELTRLRGAVEEASPKRQLVAGARRSAFPTPSQAARPSFRRSAMPHPSTTSNPRW